VIQSENLEKKDFGMAWRKASSRSRRYPIEPIELAMPILAV
jgi:hypothetical protein